MNNINKNTYKKNQMNILITGAGGPAAICAYKSLSAAGYNVFMGDMDPMSAGLYLVEEGNQFILPAGKSEQFVPFLLHLCKKHQIDLLIPTVDVELLPVSNNREAFEAIGCKVMVSPVEALQTTQDKYLLMEACKSHVKLGEYALFENFIKIPYWSNKKWVVKPRSGSGSRDIYVVNNVQELEDLSHLEGKNFMVQEFLEGKEYSIDMMIDKDGKICTAVARERMRTDSGVAVTSKVTRNAAIIKYAIAVAESLDLRFAINVQVIDTVEGPLLLEINPRFSGGLSLIIAAGADIPLMCAKNLLENEPVEVVNNYKEIAMVRYFQEKFFDPSLFLPEASERFAFAV